MNSGAAWAVRPTCSGCGWPFVGVPAKWSAGRSASAACKARAICERRWHPATGSAPTRSDPWEAYATAFPAKTHRSCGKHAGETNHIERWFGTLRARLSRLVRRAYSFSKNDENHLDAIHFFIANYNLAVKQSTAS